MRNHLAVARESVWVQIGGVLLFAAAVAAIDSLARPQFSGNTLVTAGIVLAIVPALLWLWMFYRTDKFEPEPRQYVVGVFVLGALLAYAIGQPLIRSVFRVQDWVGENFLVALLGSILVNGFVQQFLLYATVRYTVFNSSEFDQRGDGIIYGAAAGLGYATMFNIQYVVGNNGVDLGIGVMRVAVEALSLASLGAISGYFLARAKFDKMGPLWLPIGMIIAAVLNGIIDLALDLVPTLGSGFGFNPWYGLALAVVIAGITFYIIFGLLQRLAASEATPRTGQQKSVLDGVLVGEGKREEPEWVVWLVVGIALVLGFLLSSLILGQTTSAAAGKMNLTYPSRWAKFNDPGATLAAYDREHGGVFGARVSLRETTKANLFPKDGTLQDAAANWALERQNKLQSFRLLDIEPVQVQGKEAARVEYAYLLDSPGGSAGGTMPALMHGVDTLVLSGEQIYVLSFAAQDKEYDNLAGVREQILSGWRLP